MKGSHDQEAAELHKVTRPEGCVDSTQAPWQPAPALINTGQDKDHRDDAFSQSLELSPFDGQGQDHQEEKAHKAVEQSYPTPGGDHQNRDVMAASSPHEGWTVETDHNKNRADASPQIPLQSRQVSSKDSQALEDRPAAEESCADASSKATKLRRVVDDGFADDSHKLTSHEDAGDVSTHGLRARQHEHLPSKERTDDQNEGRKPEIDTGGGMFLKKWGEADDDQGSSSGGCTLQQQLPDGEGQYGLDGELNYEEAARERTNDLRRDLMMGLKYDQAVSNFHESLR